MKLLIRANLVRKCGLIAQTITTIMRAVCLKMMPLHFPDYLDEYMYVFVNSIHHRRRDSKSNIMCKFCRNLTMHSAKLVNF